MPVSANDFSELQNYTFDNSALLGLNIQSFVATGDVQDDTSTFVSLTAAISGTSDILDVSNGAPELFTIANASTITGAMLIEISAIIDGQSTFESTAELNVIGFAPDAILLASFGADSIARDLQIGVFPVSTEVAALVTNPIAIGTSMTFAADGVFTGPPPCFGAGTRIATTHGEVVIEALRAGDTVIGQVSGQPRTVTWIGRRTLALGRQSRLSALAPVRVAAGAFGPGRPRRDLMLSPDHAVHVGGGLIPVRYLLNGATVRREAVDRITYLHVELDRHDVLLAEGLPCESYLDTGNRAGFANGGRLTQIRPHFARDVWAAEACAPLVLRGPVLAQARRLLAARARALGWRRTGVPDLRVLADGRALPAEVRGADWHVALPEGTAEIRLISRAGVPAEVDLAGTDARRLGVALADARLDGAEIAADRFGAGWHAAEAGWRWTDGDATLRAEGARSLRFVLALAGRSWRPPGGKRARRRAA